MSVGAGLYMYDVVVKKFTFAMSSPDEFLLVFEASTAGKNLHYSSYFASCSVM